ncbi:MAG TPA: FHA domain-containing protein, partial [Polyangiaceae bacterium]|nr:FHA domain-containing protein [Polyangiaceae bacterium]
MDQQPPRVPLNQLALRFISGKYQGGEFPLGENKEIVVGRSSDLDMVLVEDMVSRRHARIACSDSEITIEDLGSTNGTFVNGEKIKRAHLKEGDRVLIGTSILKVVISDTANGAPRRAPSDAQRSQSGKTMSGAIDEIPLPDLLQLLGTSKKSGILVVQSDEDIGKIVMRKGTIVYASINDLEEVPPLKSAYRILTWTTGTFSLDPY